MARVLTADPNRDLCALLGFALARVGHTQIVAREGPEALALARSEGPDLILLSTEMPHLNGFDVASQIRQTSTLPIIMLSDRAGEQDQLEGFDSGADEYVIKPFSI